MSDRLSIAMLSVHSCPIGKLGSKDTGGMSVYIRELARELGRIGHRVDIFTRAHDPEDRQVVDLSNNARIIHLQVGEVEQMHKLVLYTHLADMACGVENFRRDNDLQYDLIHSHYWLSGWVGKHIQVWWNAPHIVMFHTLGASKNAIGIGEDEPELRVFNEREFVKECNRIVAATEREREELITHYGALSDRISVVPCGVDLSLFRGMDKETARHHLGFNGSNILLFVGRIEPLKGIDRLFTALPKLETERDLRLVVVGGGDECKPEVERLQILSQNLNIQDKVTFVGTVKQKDLPLYYNAADVCVIPSYYESFGLVALESLACGTPVIASRVGGMESVVIPGRNGYLVDYNAPVQLSERIAALLSKNNGLFTPSEEIRTSVVSYGWSHIADAIVKVYRSVLKEYVRV